MEVVEVQIKPNDRRAGAETRRVTPSRSDGAIIIYWLKHLDSLLRRGPCSVARGAVFVSLNIRLDPALDYHQALISRKWVVMSAAYRVPLPLLSNTAVFESHGVCSLSPDIWVFWLWKSKRQTQTQRYLGFDNQFYRETH